jgi:hypothetical protein
VYATHGLGPSNPRGIQNPPQRQRERILGRQTRDLHDRPTTLLVPKCRLAARRAFFIQSDMSSVVVIITNRFEAEP